MLPYSNFEAIQAYKYLIFPSNSLPVVKQSLSFANKLSVQVEDDISLYFYFLMALLNPQLFNPSYQSINPMHTEVLHLGATATSAFTFTLPSEFGWVLIVAAILALEILIIGFAFPGKIRGEYFTKEFMEQHFGTEHKQATGKDIEKGGAPDMGCGRYSAKLSYEQWYRFNNSQRAHMNFIQFAPSTFVLLFIAGIYFPVAAAALGLAVILARIAYSIGYTNGGPSGRTIGAIVNDFALLGLLGLSIASGIFFIQGTQSI